MSHNDTATVRRRNSPACQASIAFHEYFLPFFRQSGEADDDKHQQGKAEQKHAQRALEENQRIATRNQHGAPKLVLEHRPQDEAEEERSPLAFKLDQHVTEYAG